MITYNLNETLSRCPHNFPKDHLSYPSSAIINGVFAITAFAFALFIMFKYNSVKVWDKSFSPLYISNTLWIIFYMAIFARAACNTIRYALLLDEERELRHYLFLTGLILQGIGALALSLTINHQRRYRSSAPVHPNVTPGGEKETLINPAAAKQEVPWFKQITPLELLFAVLFLVFLVLFYLALVKKNPIFEELFLGAFVAQRLPIIIIVIIIVARGSSDGPSTKSKVVFTLGSLFHLVNDLPTFIWTQILPPGCPIVVASWLDIISMFNFISVILFFFFIRWEFLRNMEEVIWDKVNQIQTTFDFRRF